MSVQQGSTGWKWVLETVADLKEKAKKRDTQEDWNLYIWFLKEVKKVAEKKYATVTHPGWEEILTGVLQLVTCELKENMIKYKKS